METMIRYRIRADVKIEETGTRYLLSSSANQNVLAFNHAFAVIGQYLQSGWREEGELLDAHPPSDAYYVLLKLQQAHMLEACVTCDDRVMFAMSPAPGDAAFKTPLASGKAYRLNRFAYLRRDGDGLLLESPLTPCRVSVYDADLAVVIQKLCAGCAVDGASEPETLFARVLLALKIIEEADALEENDDPLALWEFHDLLFHARTLQGRSMYQIGGTYRFQGRRPPLPLLRPPVSNEVERLPEPTPALREKLARPFAAVLDERASQRSISDTPLNVEELGAFLFASARMKQCYQDPMQPYEASRRPSPSGGAIHSLEIYPLIRDCAGIAPGAYRYDPQSHGLERLAADEKKLAQLLRENPYAMIGAAIPQITFYISTRIGRVAWKYEAIAYKLINQDLGCLYQTLYLTGTALGLAPCALGSVNTALLGETLRIDWREEPFIGAFTLGKL